MWGWCIVTLASARLKASVRFPPLRGMYQTGGTCKGCDRNRDLDLPDHSGTDRNLDLTRRLLAIEDLEEAREEALTRTTEVQAKRKIDFDEKLPERHGIVKGGLVLLYDNQHKVFPGKLHTKWMGPYKVTQIYSNGSLQLEDLQGVWLDTRVNGSRVKKYKEEPASEDELG